MIFYIIMKQYGRKLVIIKTAGSQKSSFVIQAGGKWWFLLPRLLGGSPQSAVFIRHTQICSNKRRLRDICVIFLSLSLSLEHTLFLGFSSTLYTYIYVSFSLL